MGLGIGRPAQELTVREMISKVFSIYTSRFFEFVAPFILAGLASGLLSSITFTIFPLDRLVDYQIGVDVLRWMLNNLAILIVTVLLLGLVSWVIYAITGGIAVKFAADLIEDGGVDLRSAFDEVTLKIPSLLGASLITSLLMGLGFILFIVPGIIFAIIFSLVIPSIMIERLGTLESLGRSRRLVDGRWGKTFALLLAISAVIVLTDMVIGFVLISVTPPPLSTVLTGFVSSILQPIYFIGVTVLYYSMIARETPDL